MKKLLIIPIVLISLSIFSQVTETFYIKDGNDDVFQVNDEAPVFNIHYLKLGSVSNPTTASTNIGLRFQNFSVPRGSEIVSAHIQFTSFSGSANDTVTMRIFGEYSNNAKPFEDNINDVADRNFTSYPSQVEWTTQNWQPLIPGPDQKTPDLKMMIQEIIDLDGWSSGNAIVIVLRTIHVKPDSLTACSYEYANEWYAPQLIVEYINWSNIEDINQSYTYTVLPNPTSDLFKVSLHLINKESFTISLFDIAGYERIKLYDGIIERGDTDFNCSSKTIGLNPGIYFLTIKGENNSSTKKLIIQK